MKTSTIQHEARALEHEQPQQALGSGTRPASARKPLWRRGRTAGSPPDAAGADGSSEGLAREWTGPAAWITKALSVALFLTLVTGPLGLAAAVWLILRPAPVAVADREGGETTAVAEQRAAVGAFAEEYVVTWLSTPRGAEKNLAPYLPNYASVTLPQTPSTVSNPATTGVVPVQASTDGAGAAGEQSSESWSATVAVNVQTSAKDAAVRRYFQVPITWRSGSLVAQALPAPVPAPATAEAPRTAYADTAALQDPLAVSVAEFFKAFLAGGGDVTRYVTPNAPIRAVEPAPFASVELSDVQTDRDLSEVDQAAPADGESLRVLVSATGTNIHKQSISFQYALTVTARANRWEVTSIDPGPILSTSADTSDAAPGEAEGAPEVSTSSSPTP